jgi:signal transduction histidine kinase
MPQFLKTREIEVQAIGLEEVLHDVVTLIRSEMISKHVALRLVIQPGLPRVFGDPVHLTQVLLNLLTNSVQAMQSLPRDARHIVVEAHSDGAEREVVIVVQDSGPGIPAGIADQLFTTFFTTKTEGNGIGLALSRTIIEAHGGRLWCDNITKSGGATFRFTLRPALNSEKSLDNNRYPASTRESHTREANA